MLHPAPRAGWDASGHRVGRLTETRIGAIIRVARSRCQSIAAVAEQVDVGSPRNPKTNTRTPQAARRLRRIA